MASNTPVTVVPVTAVTAAEAIAFLDALERRTGVAPVDEDEHRRLAGDAPIRDRDWHWGAHLARIDDVAVAYAGVRLAPTVTAPCAVRVDLALDRSHAHADAALIAALTDARSHAARQAGGPAGDGSVQAWLRGATGTDLAAAASVAFTPSRRLHVLGLALDAAEVFARTVNVPDGLTLRTFRPDVDDAAVARLLTVVYPHGGGDWDARGIAARRETEWFDADDLLLLEDVSSHELVGVHWTRRRGDGVGEVHNLALTPAVQGQGLGSVLLDAGLAHLAAVGCREVLLWVDAANQRAVDLYVSRGFTPRWDDLALRG